MDIGFKMQIYPTKEQESVLLEYCKISHNMWNYIVNKYKNNLPNVKKYEIEDYTCKDFINDFGANIPQRVALGVMVKYNKAVIGVYKKVNKPPKFHKYNPNKQSFCVMSMKYCVKKGTITIPSNREYRLTSKKILLDIGYLNKFGIKEVINPTFIHYKNKWFLSGTYKKTTLDKSNKNYIGLDWGIKNFMTTSDGEFINYPKSVLREFQRIKRLQSIKDNKVKGSKNYYKIIGKISRAYNRLEYLKKDFIEQKTTELCRNNNIAIEDINYQEISHKKNSKFIRRQNTTAPYGRFVEKLKWKCEKFGSYFLEVEPYYTSQICCNCGQIHNLSLKDRFMKCDCGNEIDRDINAAINIKNRAELTLSSNAYLL